MKVVMVGSGNVAAVLSILIQKAGHEIVQVASRNADHAKDTRIPNIMQKLFP